MIPDRDYYADKFGKLTTDPAEAAQQIGVKGCFLDERVARRYGITDTLVSVTEPNAMRRVTGRNETSVRITKEPEIVKAEPTTGPDTEDLETENLSDSGTSADVEPEAETPQAPAKKAADQTGAKKK